MGLEIMNIWILPNFLTFLRIFIIPFFLLFCYLPFYFLHDIAIVLFLFSALTDWFDGYTARKMDKISSFGAFLDPVADKLIVTVAFMIIISKYHEVWIVIPIIINIIREILISALREWMAKIGNSHIVNVTYLGKIKTTIQMIAIIILLKQISINRLTIFGIILIYLSTFITLWSLIIYMKSAYPFIQSIKSIKNKS